jgi:hypothetical protein
MGTLLWHHGSAKRLSKPAWRTGSKWPKDAGYAVIDNRFIRDKDEIFDFIRDQKITGFCVVAGDRHAFHAGLASKALPPKKYEPLGVEFITGSISQQTLFEVLEVTMKKNHPKRVLHLIDKPDGTVIPSMNVTAMHGVLSTLKLKETGDIKQARAVRNPDVAPHLSFLDFGGHGYGLVTATSDQLSTEFVCIPRPLERSERPDGGPLSTVLCIAHAYGRQARHLSSSRKYLSRKSLKATRSIASELLCRHQEPPYLKHGQMLPYCNNGGDLQVLPIHSMSSTL